jgi:L-rhamnose-H+ transport protein
MMQTALILGVILCAIGGLAGGSFYVPFSKVKSWSWETYWLIFGVVAWMVMPLLTAWITIPDLPAVLSHSPARSLLLAYFFGAMWGVGALMFGLSVRYLGISLGMTLVNGLSVTCGTLIPPLADGQFGQLLTTFSGQIILSGVAICLAGIACCGLAGIRKERELTTEQRQASVHDFALVKGFAVAFLSGVMSSCLVFGINAGKPIAQCAVDRGVPDIYQNNPILVLVLTGGLTVNAIFCLVLNVRNRSLREYASGPGVSLLVNYLFVGLAGVLWYGAWFFFGMGKATMGKDYDFTAWPVQMALAIVTSMLWGLGLKEWKGVQGRTLLIVWGAIALLVLSAIVISAGNHLGASSQ